MLKQGSICYKEPSLSGFDLTDLGVIAVMVDVESVVEEIFVELQE